MRIAVPLSRPVLALVAVSSVLTTWNDFIWPLVTLQSDDLFPIALGLVRFRDTHFTAWGLLMSGYVIASIPLVLLFLITSRSFIEGARFARLKL
jgi:ABC-type glycerol-3-phosphate transport system permease component